MAPVSTTHVRSRGRTSPEQRKSVCLDGDRLNVRAAIEYDGGQARVVSNTRNDPMLSCNQLVSELIAIDLSNISNFYLSWSKNVSFEKREREK